MRSRRALSTVVGMVFAIIAIISTMGYVSLSMNTLNNFGQTVLQQTQQTLNAGNEKFQITSVTTPGNKFNITVANTGNIPINFTKLWVQNTTVTDWAYSYVPSKAFVNPGGTVTNIGQNLNSPLYYKPTASYNIKLVTSRGNIQGFSVNSASVAPLNIQLFALPGGVANGFKTGLIMVVTNNGTSTLTNIVPSALPAPTGFASCTAGSVSPQSVNTLPPGSTAIFKWDVTITGTLGQTCTYTLNSPLQNGYTQTVQATITVNVVTVSQASFSQTTGTLSLNFTTFRWTQGTTWNTGWNFVGSNPTAFSVQVTNNNATGDFYISKYTQLAFHAVQSGGGGKNDVPFFIVSETDLTPSFASKQYTCGNPNDYCIVIPAGQTVTLYFSASTTQNNDISSLGGSGSWFNMLLLFGKYSTSKTGSGTIYGQDIPFMAVESS